MSLNHLPEELPGEFNMNYGLGYLPGFNDAQMYITEDVNDLDICVVYCGFKEFAVQSVELIGNRTYIKTIWPAFMALLIIIELLILGIIKGFFKTEKGVSFLIIMGIALLSSIPLLFKMGLLFEYEGKKMIVYSCENGMRMNKLKEIEKNRMSEFDENGLKVYEGGYKGVEMVECDEVKEES